MNRILRRDWGGGRIAGLAILIVCGAAVPAFGQGRATVQVSARVVPLDTIQTAAVRHFAAGELGWHPPAGTSTADAWVEAAGRDLVTGDQSREARRVVVSYVRN
ncbi:MAG TPA: hypothetical protein VH879_11785 [Gemmatimonadales bacterium]|jgi:hypothetical protein